MDSLTQTKPKADTHVMRREDFGGLLGLDIWRDLVDDAIKTGVLVYFDGIYTDPDVELLVRVTGVNQ